MDDENGYNTQAVQEFLTFLLELDMEFLGMWFEVLGGCGLELLGNAVRSSV